MRILLTGAGGQLGQALQRLGAEHQLHAVDRQGLDIGNTEAVMATLRKVQPEVLINAAAYTAVDQAEKEPQQAFAVNRDGPTVLARGCRELGVPLFHVSTDYVFDGSHPEPYTEDHPVAPLGVYGESKYAGEAQIREILPSHIILRTSWVFGREGHNFVRTMLRLGAEREQLSVVDDQWGCPTFADHLAQVLLYLAEGIQRPDFAWGTFHYSDTPATTWYGFAREIFAQAAQQSRALALRELHPISTAEYPTPARRPANSVLDCRRIAEQHGVQARSWSQGLGQLLGNG